MDMPEKTTVKRAREKKKEGKASTTQAGEFVREEIRHVRRGKHGARSTNQAIAVGLSKARRAGVKLPPPQKAKPSTRKRAKRDYETGQGRRTPRKISAKQKRARRKVLKKEPITTASKQALSKQTRQAAKRKRKR